MCVCLKKSEVMNEIQERQPVVARVRAQVEFNAKATMTRSTYSANSHAPHQQTAPRNTLYTSNARARTTYSMCVPYCQSYTYKKAPIPQAMDGLTPLARASRPAPRALAACSLTLVTLEGE